MTRCSDISYVMACGRPVRPVVFEGRHIRGGILFRKMFCQNKIKMEYDSDPG